MMCLGHELALKIYPKSGCSGSNTSTMMDFMHLKTDSEEAEQAVAAILPEPLASTPSEAVISSPRKRGRKPKPKLETGQDVNSEIADCVVLDSSVAPSPTIKLTRGSGKKSPSPFVVTLVHGDILFLSGDNFEVGYTC